MPYWLCAVVFCYCLCKCEDFLFAHSSGKVDLQEFFWKPWKYQSASIFLWKQKRTPGRTSIRKTRHNNKVLFAKNQCLGVHCFALQCICCLLDIITTKISCYRKREIKREREKESILKWHISNTDSVVNSAENLLKGLANSRI